MLISLGIAVSFSHVVRSNAFGYFDENGKCFEYFLSFNKVQLSLNMEKYFVQRMLQDSELFRKVFYLDDVIVSLKYQGVCLTSTRTRYKSHRPSVIENIYY